MSNYFLTEDDGFPVQTYSVADLNRDIEVDVILDTFERARSYFEKHSFMPKISQRNAIFTGHDEFLTRPLKLQDLDLPEAILASPSRSGAELGNLADSDIWSRHVWFPEIGKDQISEIDKPITTEARQQTSGIYNFRLHALMKSWKNMYSGTIPPHLFDRVEELYFLSRDEEDQAPASISSLQGLIFILSKGVNEPEVVITLDGHYRAEWRRNRDNRVAIEFLNSTDVRFVAFYASDYQDGHIYRISGSNSVREIMDTLPPAATKLITNGFHHESKASA